MDSNELRDWRAAQRCAREGRKDTAHARWERRHMRSETTRFTVAEDEELREICNLRNITRHALIRKLLKEWIAGTTPQDVGLIPAEDIPPLTMEQRIALAEKEDEMRRRWEEENADDAFDGYL